MFNWVRSLFPSFAPEPEQLPTVGVIEPISIQRPDGVLEEDVLAVVDTTKLQSQIDKQFAIDLGLYSTDQVLDRESVTVKGKERLADVIEISFSVDSKQERSRWLVVDRSQEKHLVVLGRDDLRGYFVKIPDGE